jgi:hypothetical protein
VKVECGPGVLALNTAIAVDLDNFLPRRQWQVTHELEEQKK